MHGNVLSCGMTITVVMSSSFASSSKNKKLHVVYSQTHVLKIISSYPRNPRSQGCNIRSTLPLKTKKLHVSSYLLFINTRQKQTFTPFIISSLRKHMLGKYNLVLLSLFQIPRLQQSNINSSEKRPLW